MYTNHASLYFLASPTQRLKVLWCTASPLETLSSILNLPFSACVLKLKLKLAWFAVRNFCGRLVWNDRLPACDSLSQWLFNLSTLCHLLIVLNVLIVSFSYSFNWLIHCCCCCSRYTSCAFSILCVFCFKCCLWCYLSQYSAQLNYSSLDLMYISIIYIYVFYICWTYWETVGMQEAMWPCWHPLKGRL